MNSLIHNATLVSEGRTTLGSLLIEGGRIARVLTVDEGREVRADRTVDATGCYVLPGVIDEHVHFRDPGLTHKADVDSESRAAVAGGVTSVMDMPNTRPQTTSLDALDEKLAHFARHSCVNYSCYFGATNQNMELLPRIDTHRVCGVKLFMGSSTGNMLVDNVENLRLLFAESPLLIAAHCEDQGLIATNTARLLNQTGQTDDLPIAYHARVRDAEACYRSSSTAVRLAQRTGARLHLMHLTTARELSLLDDGPMDTRRITGEACLAHLWFTDADYAKLGTRIKCNPAIKSVSDRAALRDAVAQGRILTVATDHAPHLLHPDKDGGALRAASGMPSVQFSLPCMLELSDSGLWSLPTVVDRMCHMPARLYGVVGRGFLRPGYQADLVLVRRLSSPYTVTTADVISKCGWSPFEGTALHWRVEATWVNGLCVYQGGYVDASVRGQELAFQ